jgi:hypothetical protein
VTTQHIHASRLVPSIRELADAGHRIDVAEHLDKAVDRDRTGMASLLGWSLP